MQFLGSKNKGFTMIEMIVAIAVFTIVMVIAATALLAMITSNRKVQAEKSVTNNLNFAIESMIRTIRTGTSYATNDPAYDTLTLIDQSGRTIVYSISSGQITRSIDGSSPVAMTSPDIDVRSLSFDIGGVAPGDDEQPFVFIIIRGTAELERQGETNFDIQTFATQRYLDR